ncbi:P-loop containing nucleoside triphosphate hydrolase protein [Boletus edulis BED1]|uniref:P-loop containing nucleoside triphosphate hydrolase protein n=1 Tax=Boletus edulis BED1 TaxID=1328754 RepID=A0AAD4BLV3_BOLED|nr:P-loop containing nucleoside triphosphate hydrolase protein [Boletus edulis BED1]
MRRTITQDQSLIISGETGSGKSETRRLAIKTLLELYRYLGHRAGTGTRANGVRDDDANRFEQLKSQDGSQLVAAILHLGNIEFIIDRGRDVDAAVVRNVDVLGIVAEFLGIQPSALETTLAYKTKLVKRELCTVFLTLMTLYTLLFAWLNEHVNQRLCRDDFDAFIGLFDLPGPQNMTSRPNSLDKFCIKFANERLQNFIQKCIFESHVDEYQTEGISRFIPSVPYFDNAECPGGLIHIMDDQARRSHKKTDLTMVEAFGKRWGNHSSFKVGPVDQSGSPTFLERTLDFLNPDSISLLRGSLAGVGPANPFVKGLFSAKAIATQVHPKNEDTIVSAQQPVKPMRTPSTHRKGTVKRMATLRGGSAVEEQEREDDDVPNSSSGLTPCVAGEFRAALSTLFKTLSETQSWFVFYLNANDSQSPNQLEGRSLKGQIQILGLTEVSKRNVNVFGVGLTLDEFCTRSAKEKVEQTRNALGLQETDIVLGQFKVFLSQAAFHSLEDRLRSLDVEEQKRNRLRDAEAEAGLDVRSIGDPYAPYASPGLPPDDYADPYNQVSSQAHVPLVANASPFQRGNLYEDDYEDRKSFRSDDFDNRSRVTSNGEETNSNYGSESYAPSRNMFQNADKEGLIANEALAGEIMENETTEVVKETSARRRWVLLCWLLTWWIPSIFLKWFGRMKREDVRQAWQEKFTLNVIIWFICACAVFVIPVLGVICPTEHVFSTSELASHSFSNSANNVYTAIRASRQRHPPTKSILQYGGQDATNLFPVQVSALCNSVPGSVSPWVQLSAANTTDLNAQYHDFRAVSNDSRPDWDHTVKWLPVRIHSSWTAPSSTFKYSSGQDLTKAIDNLNTDSGTLAAQKTCLHNLFLIGMVDNRNSPQCLFLQRP